MYQILMIGIFLTLLVFGFLSYSKFQERQSVRMLMEEKEPMFAKGVSSIQREREREKDNYKGKLMESCPCSEGYECSAEEGNICKIKEGGTCSLDSDCSSNSFCFNALCTLKPKSNNLSVRSTPMFLKRNRFVVPKNWWEMNDIVDICKVNKDEEAYYLLTENGIVIKSDVNPRINGHIEKAQITRMDRILSFDKKYYGITNGYLYQLEDDMERVWSWGKINKFYTMDMSQLSIYDADVVEDMIYLYTNQGIYTYTKSSNEWTGPDAETKRICYGRNQNVYVREDTEGNLAFHQNGKTHPLSGDIIDFAVDKDNDDTIYLLYRNNVCYANIYDKKDGGADDVTVKLIGSVKRIIAFPKMVWGISTFQEHIFS